MNIQYRKLAPNESGLYRSIRLECLKNFPDNFGSIYEEQITLSKLPFETYIETQSQDKFTLGAFDGDSLIGICSVSLDTKKTRHRHIGEIIQMFVKPEYKGNKIGLNLLHAAIKEAFEDPQIEQLTLCVVTSNAPAIRIYEQAGFSEYGLLKNNFKDGDKYFDQKMMVLYRQS